MDVMITNTNPIIESNIALIPIAEIVVPGFIHMKFL
jgi:hypothetical protein